MERLNAVIGTAPTKIVFGSLPVMDMTTRTSGAAPTAAAWQYIDGAHAFNSKLDQRLLAIFDAQVGGRHEPSAQIPASSPSGDTGASIDHEVILATGSIVGVRFVQRTMAGGVQVGHTEEITYEELGTGLVSTSATLIDTERIGALRKMIREVDFPSASIASTTFQTASTPPGTPAVTPAPVHGPIPDVELLSAISFTETGNISLAITRNPDSGLALDTSVTVTLSPSATADVLSPAGRAIRQSVVAGAVFAAPAASPAGSKHVNCDIVACVALSYDDGPNAQTTRLLNVLEQHKVSATFFQQGSYVISNPQVAASVTAAGHTVGNHTMSHPYLTRLSAEGVVREVRGAQAAIEKVTGVAPAFLRPPYGATNASVAALVGLPQITWDVDSLDWQSRNKDIYIPRIMSLVKPGSIILQHDIHAVTVDGQDELITRLKAKGYYPVTLPQLFAGIDLKPGGSYKCRGTRPGCVPGR